MSGAHLLYFHDQKQDNETVFDHNFSHNCGILLSHHKWAKSVMLRSHFSCDDDMIMSLGFRKLKFDVRAINVSSQSNFSLILPATLSLRYSLRSHILFFTFFSYYPLHFHPFHIS